MFSNKKKKGGEGKDKSPALLLHYLNKHRDNRSTVTQKIPKVSWYREAKCVTSGQKGKVCSSDWGEKKKSYLMIQF